MYISGAGQPIRSLDACPLLLDSVFCGGDVILINEGGDESELLGRAATRLTELRSRVIRISDVLPDGGRTSMQSQDAAGPSRLSIPDDDFLTQSYRALTVVDAECDRIVLLIGDAHALQHSALRYIQFMCRSSGQLQLVFCGKREFLALLEAESLSWLRKRLLDNLVIDLAPPVVQAVPFMSTIQAATARRTAAFHLGRLRPRFINSMSSRNVRLGPLALVGLGGAAWLTLCMQNGAKTGPTVSRQDLGQQTTSKTLAILGPNTQKNERGVTLAAPQTTPATLDASASQPSEVVGDTRGTGLASPLSKPPALPSTLIPSKFFLTQPEIRITASKPSFTEPPVSKGLSNRGDRSVSATSQDNLDAPAFHLSTISQLRVLSSPIRQASDLNGSHPVASVPLSATWADANRAVVTGSVQDANPRTSSSIRVLPSSGAAPGPVFAVMPQARTGLLLSKTRLPLPEAVPAPNSDWRSVPAVSSYTPATPVRRARRFKLLPKQIMPLVANDPWLAPQPVSSLGDGPQSYVGSYATDAKGMRVFRPDP